MSPPTAAAADGQEVITHRVRQQLCAVLDRTESIAISKLAARIADSVAVQVADGTEQVRITLRHNHLPRLADRGLIRYAPGDERVSIPERVSFETGAEDRVTYAAIDKPEPSDPDEPTVFDPRRD